MFNHELHRRPQPVDRPRPGAGTVYQLVFIHEGDDEIAAELTVSWLLKR